MKTQLYTNIRGTGDVIILLHGLFGCSDNLSRIAKELSEGYETHALDLRNHGRSFHEVEMSYELMAKDVVDYMDSKNIENAIVLGHSMGGKVAMSLALNYSTRVNKLIVADIAPVKYEPHHHEILEALCSVDFEKENSRTLVDQKLSLLVAEQGVRQFLLKNIKHVENGDLSWKLNLSAINDNYPNILDGMTCEQPFSGPVMFIAGSLSDYIKPEYSEKTLKLFPYMQIKVIAGASHWLHAEQPRIFLNICLRFLK